MSEEGNRFCRKDRVVRSKVQRERYEIKRWVRSKGQLGASLHASFARNVEFLFSFLVEINGYEFLLPSIILRIECL